MRIKYNKISLGIILLISMFVTSCQDDFWNEHYDAPQLKKSNLNIYQYLQSRQEVSTFTKMLKQLGYDSILTKNQTFTVWAPTNDALKDVNLSDTLLVRRIVTNHIMRYSNSTLGISKKSRLVLMMDNKYLLFSASNNVYTFGGKNIKEPDIATQNGIIHIVSEYAPYLKNIWEFISETPGLDSIRNYINSQTIKKLDNSKSFKNGVFVDSVFMNTNYIFDYLAALQKEDSIYTAILPDNSAWAIAYNAAMPYFNTQTKDGGIASQISSVKGLIVNNLFFKGAKTLPLAQDSIVSTSGNYFLHADRLFAGSQANLMSNGYSYVTSQMKNDPSESWLKPVGIEAEDFLYYGGTTSNYNSGYNSSLGTGYNISGKRYLTLTDASTSSLSTLFATFPLPGNLSTKYNIYCVFVPSTIIDTADVRPYKVKFSISYTNNLGALVKDAVVDANNSINTKVQATFTTDPTKVQKMLVLKDFALPYRWVYPQSSTTTTADILKSITLSLKVTNATSKAITETAKYNRNLKIDCIILEPIPVQ